MIYKKDFKCVHFEKVLSSTRSNGKSSCTKRTSNVSTLRKHNPEPIQVGIISKAQFFPQLKRAVMICLIFCGIPQAGFSSTGKLDLCGWVGLSSTKAQADKNYGVGNSVSIFHIFIYKGFHDNSIPQNGLCIFHPCPHPSNEMVKEDRSSFSTLLRLFCGIF